MENTLKLAEIVGEKLKSRHLTVSAAESCTGGLLTSYLTDVSGSSAYVMGAVVTYSNAAKMQFAGVNEATLIAHGAVSEPTAREMAVGICATFGTDVGLSVTGIAGPTGGTPEKPVGLVYIGVVIRGESWVERHIWSGDRVSNKQQSAHRALAMLSELLGD